MHTAAVIILCFAATASAGLLFAGLAALLAHDDAQLRRIQERVAAARRGGYWHAYFTMRAEVSRISDIVSHWRTRSEARWSVWLGLAFGVVAIIAAQFL